MAKNKDLEDENINEENQGDINDADDSFGLPDIDYQPLDESEEPVSEEEPEDEPTFAFTPEPEEETEEPTEYEEESTTTYASGIEDEPETADYDEESEGDQEQEYVPGSYTPPKENSSKAGLIIGIVLVLLAAAAAIWYFGFHRPAKQAELARIEKQRQERLAEEKLEADRKAEQDRAARERAEAEAAAAEAEALEEAKSEPGTIEAISARTGRYYVVVASAIDGDLARDYAKELAASGESVKIIEPYGSIKFYRVTIQDLDTWTDAESRANELKGQYGDGVWVIKY